MFHETKYTIYFVFMIAFVFFIKKYRAQPDCGYQCSDGSVCVRKIESKVYLDCTFTYLHDSNFSLIATDRNLTQVLNVVSTKGCNPVNAKSPYFVFTNLSKENKGRYYSKLYQDDPVEDACSFTVLVHGKLTDLYFVLLK